MRVKQVKLGKVVKRKDEKENKFTLSIKQIGKLSGKEQRQLKSDIEKTCELFLQKLYFVGDEKQQINRTV